MLEIRHDRMNTTASTLAAYNELYADRGILHQDSFYLWLIGLLRPQAGKRLLDISCGEGRLVVLAKQQRLQAFGMDFAIEGLRRVNASVGGSGWAVADGEGLPLPDKCVDYVTHIGSLEHYINPDLGAKEIARVLRDDGQACILVPNAYGLLGNVLHVMRWGEIFDDGQPVQRYATRKNWENLLQQGGLRVDKTIRYGELNLPRTPSDVLWMLRRPHKIVRFLISPLIPVNLANDFVFLCSHA